MTFPYALQQTSARNRPYAGDGRDGSALVTTTGVIVIVMLITGSLSTYVLSGSHSVRRMADMARARAIAEAGANRAYDALRDNYSLRSTTQTNLFPRTDFGGGSYIVAVDPDDANNVTRVVSTGRFRSAEYRVGVDLRDTNVGAGIPRFAEYAIFSNGSLTLNGSPQEMNGDLHSNDQFTLNGNYDTVNGLVYAPNSSAIPEAHRGDWAPVHFPRLSDPDFQEFLDAARAAGILTEYSGDQTFQGSHTFDGITVVDGSVTFRGSGTREINGLLYISEGFTANGSTSMSGSILVGGNATINGSSAILGYQPPPGSALEPHVVVSGWWD